jgi:hypothetical protein
MLFLLTRYKKYSSILFTMNKWIVQYWDNDIERWVDVDEIEPRYTKEEAEESARDWRNNLGGFTKTRAVTF